MTLSALKCDEVHTVWVLYYRGLHYGSHFNKFVSFFHSLFNFYWCHNNVHFFKIRYVDLELADTFVRCTRFKVFKNCLINFRTSSFFKKLSHFTNIRCFRSLTLIRRPKLSPAVNFSNKNLRWIFNEHK